MTEKNLKIDEILEELHTLRDENYFLRKQNSALKMRCSKYSLQISDLETEINDMKFTRQYLTSEEAGRKFAQELLGSA